MINCLSKSLLSLLVICNLTNCQSTPSHNPGQKMSIGEKLLNASPNKPENLSKITCLTCHLEIDDSNMTMFFKTPKSIDFNISSIFDREGEKYFGFKYDLGKDHQAVVFGHDYYEGGIDFYLIVWNKSDQEFVSEPLLISGMRGDGGQFEYIESTISDINDDNIPDLITHQYTVYRNVEIPELKSEILDILTFNEGEFEVTHGTEEQFTLYKTKSFSLPERKPRTPAEDIHAARNLLDSIQGVANCGCDQLKTSKGITNMFTGLEAMHNNQFLADDLLRGEAIHKYYRNLHLCEYLLVFGCEEQFLYDDEFRYQSEIINGYRKLKESDFKYFADFYRILNNNEFHLTDEVKKHLNELLSDNQYLKQFEGY